VGKDLTMPSAGSVGRRLGGIVVDLWYLFWKTVVWVLAKTAFRLRIEGREHEPARGPFVVAANHSSAIDPPLVGTSLHHRAAYMAKHELFAVPILGPLLRSIGVFPVRRGQPDRKAIRTSLDVLTRGGVLVMFPEGTRSPDGRLQSPEAGAAMIALRTGVAVLPVAVISSHRILPKGARWPKFQQVTVRMGPPLTVPRVEGRLDHQILEEWGTHIIVAIERLLPADQQRAREPGSGR
jgi:1-acyl-sn-glycerol-3-phosphate acyltransferase